MLRSDRNRTRFRFMVLLVLLAGTTPFVCSYGSAHAADTHGNSPDPGPLLDLEPHYRASVLRGWRYFQTSFARDGMACVHCHLRYETLRLWAPAYPKVQIFDGTPYQVKGLKQVVTEALERHTDLPKDRRSALVEDLLSYISWWGNGQPISPGRSRSFPPPAEDLAELKSSVERGRSLFNDEAFGPCTRCHAMAEETHPAGRTSVRKSAAAFPRYVALKGKVLCLETFLSWHLKTHCKTEKPGNSVVIDLAAYLFDAARGERLHSGTRTNVLEK